MLLFAADAHRAYPMLEQLEFGLFSCVALNIRSYRQRIGTLQHQA